MLYYFEIKGYGIHAVIIYASSEDKAWEYLAADYSQSVEGIKSQFYISEIKPITNGVLFTIVE